jgi:hypothetical protein
MSLRNLLVARDAQHHAVVKLGLAAIGVLANVVRVKGELSEIGTAALTFAISGDHELPNLTRREETATIHAVSHGCGSGVAPNPHVISQMAPARRAYRVGLIGPRKGGTQCCLAIYSACVNRQEACFIVYHRID